MKQDLKDHLEKNNVSYEVHEHPAVFTVEDSKKLKNEIPGLHCKCLFLKGNNQKFYLVAMPAEKRLEMKSLRKKLDVKKLHFSSSGELKERLNLTPGSVSIFGMIHAKPGEVVFIIDKEVWDAGVVGFHPNINTATLEISHENLERFLNSLDSDKKIMEL
ncbi:MAG: prolyl-tRNA synthetase associated domain-containing protein [Nanoarchaeota archaeon]